MTPENRPGAPAPTLARTFYGLRHAQSGELMRLAPRGGEYGGGCELVRDEQYEPFAVETAEELALALFENTPGYNSSDTCPNWGGHAREDLVPVKVTMTTAFEPVALEEPLKLRTVEVRDIHRLLARRYAGADALEGLPENESFVFWLVELPEGETLASLRDREGELLFGGDKWTRRKLVRALPVPEDYADLFKTTPGVLLIATGIKY